MTPILFWHKNSRYFPTETTGFVLVNLTFVILLFCLFIVCVRKILTC